MYYILYKITNKINNKIYIGIHKTKDINDDYMGSGKYLKRAQEKYGIENFKKEILKVFDNSKDMFNAELEMVNEDFIKRTDTYNLKRGGYGGWDHVDNTGRIVSEETKAKLRKSKENISIEIRKNMSEAQKGIQAGEKNGMHGRNHTEESKRKISEAKQKLCLFEGMEMTILERSKKKLSRTTKGTESGKIKSQKSADTVALRNPWYNLYHITKGLIQENIPQKEVNKISQILINKTKDNYMGKTTRSKGALKRANKLDLVGLYVERIII